MDLVDLLGEAVFIVIFKELLYVGSWLGNARSSLNCFIDFGLDFILVSICHNLIKN